MKVVIASDSFKGCLTSAQVASAAAAGVTAVFPDARVVCLEMSDGGEGLVSALAPRMGARKVSVEVQGPLGEPVMAEYAVKGNTAIIEMASACGLTFISGGQRNPMKTSTFGLGQIIKDALSLGCREFLVGLGGSATNDAGMGMLQALGWRFLDVAGSPLPGTGESLRLVCTIDGSDADPRLKESSFRVACDVNNPFWGPTGAAFVYAPQKGADPAQVILLDDGLRHFAGVMTAETGVDVQGLAGSGAAGGLGGALAAFLGASLLPGADIVLDIIGFDCEISDADMVITGEGRMDAQTLHGKAAACVLARSRQFHVPVVAICGSLEMTSALGAAGFERILTVSPEGLSMEEAMRTDVAQENIRKACMSLIRICNY